MSVIEGMPVYFDQSTLTTTTGEIMENEKTDEQIEQDFLHEGGVDSSAETKTSYNHEEINKLIHEKLFGKCWHKFQTSDQIQSGYVSCVRCGAEAAEFGVVMPDYCASIGAAWRVVEKLNESFYIVRVSAVPAGNSRKNTVLISRLLRPNELPATLMNMKIIDVVQEFDIFAGESLPRAICEAALAAVEIENNRAK